MDKQLTLGLAKIHAEAGEVRAFSPGFVHKMSQLFSNVVLENGYGESLGSAPSAYLKSDTIRFAPASEVYAQDYVLVLRYPPNKLITMMHPGSCLISMCHFHTRPKRREFLRQHEIEAISLDSLTDDNGQRLVENLRAVAWNGCEIAFQVMGKITTNPKLSDLVRSPLNITILGSGGVGIHAVQAAIRYGNIKLWHEFAEKGVPGNIVRVVDYDLTSNKAEIQTLLESTDLLIDATQRKDPAQIIIPNSDLSLMPEKAVILDLSVDPYDFKQTPFEVKGIEGIPQGNLDQYIFSPDDPAWNTLPKTIRTNNRRWVVSCYSWPGIHPRSCMMRYGNQISPLLRRLVSAGIEGIHPGGQYHERALARGMLKFWEK